MYLANLAAIFLAVCFVLILAGSLLWRVGLWSIPPVEQLHTVEGLPIGSRALEIAALSGANQYHLTFGVGWTFLIFGTSGCEPCRSLLKVASEHVATREMRLVYVGDSENDQVDCDQNVLWEVYRFDDEDSARRHWRAPVSPYFHVIDPRGRVAAKGIATKPAHLDRLLSIAPAGVSKYSQNSEAG